MRLLLAPLDVAPLALTDPPSPYLAPLLQTLLAVPALPSSIPLQSLTYLSSALPLFSTLLPAAAAEPTLLAGGRLAEEAGRMCFLANLATFGITGGMLQRHGVAGTEAWIRVVGAMLGSLSAGWGRWAEGAPDAVPAVEESDSDDDAGKPGSGSRSRTPARPVLPPAVSSRLLLLASPAHLSTLVGFVVSTAKPDLMSGFSAFVLGILYAFRGSSRWEGTLDALLDGKRGRALVKLLWREGVRNRWPTGAEPSAAEAWDTFTKSKTKLCSSEG